MLNLRLRLRRQPFTEMVPEILAHKYRIIERLATLRRRRYRRDRVRQYAEEKRQPFSGYFDTSSRREKKIAADITR